MILTVIFSMFFLFFLALVTVESVLVYRELIARTEKHKSEARFYDTMTEYIQEKNVFIVDEVSI